MWRRKVVWSEGLFLRPQHFQQQERYFENLVARRAGSLRSYGWGFETLELDDAALGTGSLVIRQASGVLPDGTVFNVPLDDAAPQALALRTDHPRDSLVYLAIVAERAGMPSASLDGDERSAAALRFGSTVVDVVDSNQGFAEAAPVQLGDLQLKLVGAAEISGAYCAMPLARVVERRADGQVVLDRQFTGPTLSVNDCGLLRGLLVELRGLLSQRVEALAGRMTQPGRGGVAEIADFLFLQSVNRGAALMEHLANVPKLHPESFYVECVQLAGELSGYGPERRLTRPFPAYDHDDLGATFRPVIAQLRAALSMTLSQSAIPIELHDRNHGVRVAIVPDKSLLSSASFVLAVGAQMPSETLRQRFPSQLKVGPVEKIRDLVMLQLPGIGLRALPVAPRQIPYHAGFNYFELDNRHELWPLLKNSGGLAMHLAGDFPGLELEFWAVRN
ncbi:MAG: type VI secretion system baseplate subunit TssK [Lautropia sp.]